MLTAGMFHSSDPAQVPLVLWLMLAAAILLVALGVIGKIITVLQRNGYQGFEPVQNWPDTKPFPGPSPWNWDD